nr:MAG TPA: tail length tape measure protein [Caudoviricetes sp.]
MATTEELQAVITLIDDYTENLMPIIQKTREMKALMDSVKPKISAPKDKATPIYKRVVSLIKKIKEEKITPKEILIRGAKATKELAKIRKDAMLLNAKRIALNIKNTSTASIAKLGSKLKEIVKKRWEARIGVKDKASSVLNKIKGAALALAAIKAITIAVKASDQFSQTRARLNLMNDGQMSTKQLESEIFKKSMDSRTDVQTMSDVVSRLGITAGDKFKNNKEIVDFSSLLSKQFKISGASGEEQSSAMYQLSQAMASGALQGDEFRTIKENAPLLAKAIQKELGDKDIKTAASNGEITSDLIKRAMFNSAGEIEERFNKIPWTFKDAMTMGLNGIKKGAEPVFEGLNSLVNNSSVKSFISELPNTMKSTLDNIGGLLSTLNWDGIFNSFTTSIQPAIDLFKSLHNHIVTKSPESQAVLQTFGTIVKTVFEGMRPVIQLVGSVIRGVMGWIASHSKEIQTIVQALGIVWKTVWWAISGVIKAVGKIIGPILSSIVSVISGIANIIIKAKNAWESFKKAISGGATVKVNYSERGGLAYGTDSGSGNNGRSRAMGQKVIPRNNYPINAHEGEMLLTKQDANEYRDGRGKSSGINIIINGLTIRENADIDLLAGRVAKKINLAVAGGV